MTHSIRFAPLALVVWLAGCATLPVRPASLDTVEFPTATFPSIGRIEAPTATLTERTFPVPVLAGETNRTQDEVTIEAAPGPYDQLKPYTRKWMAEWGVYLFRVTLTNRSPHTSSLERVNVRLLVGEDRVTPIGLDDAVGGDTRVESGRADSRMLQERYAEWRRANGLDPATVAAAIDVRIEKFTAKLNARHDALTKEAEEIVDALYADIETATANPPFLNLSNEGNQGWWAKRGEWRVEVRGKRNDWRHEVDAEYQARIAEASQQRAAILAALDKQMRYDLDSIQLTSGDLRSVTLLPNGDRTTVFLAFQVSPGKLRNGATLTLYGVPVAFDRAGDVATRTNVEFPFAVR